jgi:hypothetical protein
MISLITIRYDWKSYDIAHMQIELVVNDLDLAVNILKQNAVQFVSSGIVNTETSCPYRQGCLVKDPNGHTILLVMD